VEQLFLSFQRELKFQREQMEALRKDNLTLRAKLAEEQGAAFHGFMAFCRHPFSLRFVFLQYSERNLILA